MVPLFYPGQAIADALRAVQAQLKICGIPSPLSEGEKLVCEALDLTWSELQLYHHRTLPESKPILLEAYLARRSRGEPLAYIANRAWFFDREYYVDSRVLIPRSETEILVEKALEVLPKNQHKVIVDLGTGSGCIGLTLARLRPMAQVVLVDQSAEALEVAKQNSKNLGIENDLLWLQAEVQEQTQMDPAPFDLIVANPPYIPQGDPRLDNQVKNFEPALALFSKKQGLECIHKWLQWSYHNLRKGGHGFFEFGKGQEIEIYKFIENLGLAHEETYEDYQRIPRVLHFRKV